VDLHRLVWSPDDFQDEKLLSSAIRRADLSGEATDYVSVSRTDKIQAEAEIKIAESQSQKSGSQNVKRDEAWSVLFNSDKVKSFKDEDGAQLFDVTEEPIEENLAHCGIRNVSGINSKGHVNKLRATLVSLAHSRKRLEEFLLLFSQS